MSSVQVSVKNDAAYRRVFERLTAVSGTVRAGILAGATTTDGKAIAPYAAANEFGTARIPPRPFMRTVAKDRPRQWARNIAGLVYGRSHKKEAWDDALWALGEKMTADIKASIQYGNWAPNSPCTVAAKKAKGKREPNHPLIDTGQMLEAVNFEVTER